MKIIDKSYALKHRKEILREMKVGKIFVYPTDTIYGVGCNALRSESVLRIREMKNREEKPFSVIAPSIEWIYGNCEVSKSAEKWIRKLPGPYTLILPLKDNKVIAKEVVNGIGSVGVRIPNNWFYDFVKESGIPFVTTSVNISGEPHMTQLENMNKEIGKNVDYIVFEGPIIGSPSTIVDLTGNAEKIIRR